MKIKFGSWNINSWRTLNPQLRLIKQENCDILALQEVTSDAYAILVNQGLFAAKPAFSLDLRPPAPGEGKKRSLGCAVCWKEGFALLNSHIIDQAPAPERTLVVDLNSPGGPLKICSFHVPPGSTWGRDAKSKTFEILSEWLSKQTAPIIFGMDANTPMREYLDISKNEWWPNDAGKSQALLGSNPTHVLRDTFRVHLSNHPEALGPGIMAAPYGPLATSHKRNGVPCRYDFIYTSPDFEVLDVRYLYEEACAAGSDHAIVVAELEMA